MFCFVNCFLKRSEYLFILRCFLSFIGLDFFVILIFRIIVVFLKLFLLVLIFFILIFLIFVFFILINKLFFVKVDKLLLCLMLLIV